MPGFENAGVPAFGAAATAHAFGRTTLSSPSFSGRAILGFPMRLAAIAKRIVLLFLSLLLHLHLRLALTLGVLRPVTLRLHLKSAH